MEGDHQRQMTVLEEQRASFTFEMLHKSKGLASFAFEMLHKSMAGQTSRNKSEREGVEMENEY